MDIPQISVQVRLQRMPLAVIGVDGEVCMFVTEFAHVPAPTSASSIGMAAITWCAQALSATIESLIDLIDSFTLSCFHRRSQKDRTASNLCQYEQPTKMEGKTMDSS